MGLMAGFRTLPRSSGQSEAAKRIIAAGEAYQRRKAFAEQDATFRAKVRAVQTALDGAPPPFARLKELAPASPAMPVVRTQVESILKDACLVFGVRKNELLSARRGRLFVIARHYAAQRLHDETSLSLPRIGRVLGGRDHTTIMHAIDPVRRARVAEALKPALAP